MKVRSLAVAIAVVTIAALAFFGVSVNTAQASITSTLHNLSPSGTGLHATGTEQDGALCIWCHTPHLASTTMKPLWNKPDISTSFTAYGTTEGGTVVGAPGGSSLACLSCHDGADAINSLILDSSGANVAGPVSFGGVATAVTMPAGVYNVGIDLTTVHPISVTYDTTKASLNPTTNAWGTGTIAGVLDASSNIQCSSCHDPHAAAGDTTSVGGTVAGPHFLRMVNTNSALCLTCHGK